MVIRARPGFFAGIFFVSAATLCLEVSLTRYFGISQDYHFAFLVISIAFLGYGASGTFLSLFGERGRPGPDRFLSISSFLFALSIPVSFLLSNSVPFDVYRIPWDRKQIFLIPAYYFCFGLPFFFAGATISCALTRLASLAHKIYFFDLLGAGAGSFFAALVFLPLGDKGVFGLISVLALTGCLLLSRARGPLFRGALLLPLLAIGFLLVFSPGTLKFRISPFKALPQALRFPQARLDLTKWSSSFRVDIVDSPAARFAPGLSLLWSDPLPPQLGLSVDAAELNAVTRFEGGQDPSWKFLSDLPSSFPYFVLSAPRVLVLEPKGGLDVQAATVFQASRTKAVEGNPLIVSLLRRELASYWGGLYDRPDVEVASSEVRSELNRERGPYDLIVISLADTSGASGTGLYGTGENYLLTVDSFSRLLHLLSPHGIISQTLYLLPPPRPEARILATWIEALQRQNLEPALRIAAVRSWGTISFFIKKSPWDAAEISRLRNFCRDRLFDTAYYPGIKKEELNLYNQMEKPVYEELFSLLLPAASRKDFYVDYLFDVEPVTDNRPFFYSFFKWGRAGATYEALGRNPSILLQGKFLLGVLLVQAGVSAFVFVLLPLGVFRKNGMPRSALFSRVFFYFGLIGAAFIFIEIILIQKFILFLGQPLYSVSAVVFTLLLSSGMGSLSSKKILGKAPARNMKAILLLLSGLIAFYLFLLPPILEEFMGFALAAKLAVSLAIIFPLGFVMGFPFPTGLRLLEKAGRRLLPWAWSTNAFSTVVNSILAQALALSFGYNAVWILAAGAYLAALPFFGFPHHGNEADS
jgi:hypothetical protein